MSARRAAMAVSTMIVSIIVAIAVPVASLKTVSTTVHCCCPDPAFCHCPDHGKQPPDQAPTMRTCHRTEVAVVAPGVAAFVPVRVATVTPQRSITLPTMFVLDIPHASPFPVRPDAPS